MSYYWWAFGASLWLGGVIAFWDECAAALDEMGRMFDRFLRLAIDDDSKEPDGTG